MLQFIKSIPAIATALLLVAASSATAQEMFAKVDANADGALDKTEFAAFIDAAAQAGRPNAKKIQSANLYAQAFARIDKNKDGSITQAELAAMR
ncbi:EF-hand domain-containing protein [Ciceribacter sp. L1K23]|uniref:EF-hand domain-containing protein n=1 Tax=unclassified Ciceribacter TaxID=2628820 RepID=UPI001ABDA003|nr:MULTISPECIES: EF-hand domain-containing protein [unclassified Ciceribacter]MBO3758400.1 EF-hand domain-containing protein [Ciceribacter sp. L1K22]MBR0557035.1 EF-hand domain-containing protein [Ciceribacter sp. L1K23]